MVDQPQDLVVLPDAPVIPGLRFRPFHGEADYPAMAAVHEGSWEWDRIDSQSARERIPTAADLAGAFAEAPPGGPDILIAEVAGQVVGYNHVLHRWTEETGTRVYLHLGYLLPAWRGRGIGGAMLHWARERIRAIARDERQAGSTTFATNVTSTEREAGALMRQNGYTDVRRLSDMAAELPVELRRDLPSMSLPAGVALKPLEEAHYRAVYQAWKDAFAGMWTSTPESEDDYREFVADNVDGPGCDPTLYRIAWAGDQVVGLVFARVQRGVGTIPEVAVRKAWQRRGIARCLMMSALQALQDRGLTQARLFTDAADGQGARSLYEGLGFREVKQHIFYRKPLN